MLEPTGTAVSSSWQCLLADRCPHCCSRQAYVLGLAGFGWRRRGHAYRCAARRSKVKFVDSVDSGVPFGKVSMLDLHDPEHANKLSWGETEFSSELFGAAEGVSHVPEIEHLQPVTRAGLVDQFWAAAVGSQRQQAEALDRSSELSTSSVVGRMMCVVPEGCSLGRGRFGSVWRARDQTTENEYAVKNIGYGAASCSGPEDVVEALALNECQAAECIRMQPHPCIVQYKAVFHFADVKLSCIVMELCPDGTLTDVITGARAQAANVCRPYRPPAQALHWIGQLFLALEHLHKRTNLLFRDLKTDNVMISKNGRLKLTDVGSAHFGICSDGRWTLGMPSGSPGYVAPEILRNEKYDSSADLYSYGALCWVVLVGGDTSYSFPSPPFSQVQMGRNFSPLLNDWERLQRLVKKPADRAAGSLSKHSTDFVLRLIQRRPCDRLRHEDIRSHNFMQALGMPPVDAQWGQIEEWLATVPQFASSR